LEQSLGRGLEVERRRGDPLLLFVAVIVVVIVVVVIDGVVVVDVNVDGKFPNVISSRLTFITSTEQLNSCLAGGKTSDVGNSFPVLTGIYSIDNRW
jgi:hypothetical protein